MKGSPNLTRLHQKKSFYFTLENILFSQVFIKESIIPKMPGLKAPQKWEIFAPGF